MFTPVSMKKLILPRGLDRTFLMAGPSDIFAKQRLTVGQLRAVAERRFGDAVALVETDDNARANGAQYLAGIVIEILLKGQLLRLNPQLASLAAEQVGAGDRKVWGLIWRSHSLIEMLDELPLLRWSVKLKGERAGQPYLRWLENVCADWSIHARYSSLSSKMANARQMLDRVRILKEVIK
jgi:hypothetical protein